MCFETLLSPPSTPARSLPDPLPKKTSSFFLFLSFQIKQKLRNRNQNKQRPTKQKKCQNKVKAHTQAEGTF